MSGETGGTDELVEWLNKASTTIYLAIDAAVADDISPKLREVARVITSLRAERDAFPTIQDWRDLKAKCAAAESSRAAEKLAHDRTKQDFADQTDACGKWIAKCKAAEQRVAALRGALTRQCDNMAFVINHVDIHRWAEKFLAELEEDRAALASEA